MNIQYIITKSLLDYDEKAPIIKYLVKNGKKVETVRKNSDTERNNIKFYDDERNLILETDYEVLGIYYDKLHVWSWAWSHTALNNAETYLSREVLNHALKWGSDLSYLKTMLTSSRSIVREKAQLDINLALGSNIIKQPYIYPYVYRIDDANLIYYLILLNRSDLDRLDKIVLKPNEMVPNSHKGKNHS
jgi:hypothetical protein